MIWMYLSHTDEGDDEVTGRGLKKKKKLPAKMRKGALFDSGKKEITTPSNQYRIRDLTFIIGGGGDRVEFFEKSIFFRRPPTLESKFFLDSPPQVKKFS